jgi:hypothetical protein
MGVPRERPVLWILSGRHQEFCPLLGQFGRIRVPRHRPWTVLWQIAIQFSKDCHLIPFVLARSRSCLIRCLLAPLVTYQHHTPSTSCCRSGVPVYGAWLLIADHMEHRWNDADYRCKG